VGVLGVHPSDGNARHRDDHPACDGQGATLDVTFIDEEDLATPWKRSAPSTKQLPGTMPKSLTVTLSNIIFFEKAQLPQSLANRLIRLAAFQNPDF
jgi:hypothetical protein